MSHTLKRPLSANEIERNRRIKQELRTISAASKAFLRSYRANKTFYISNSNVNIDVCDRPITL